MPSRFTQLAKVLSLAMLLVFAASQVIAQSIVTGDAVGTVTDPSGAVVSGASVTLTSVDTGASQTVTTASNGFYRFPLLKPGQYRLTVKQSGFKGLEEVILVSVGQILTTNIKLELGNATEVLEVTGAAPLIETENANLATTYSTQQLEALPTPGGDITSYAYSAPGITLNSAAGYGNFSAYGLPSTSNLFTTNGNDNMDPYLNLNNSGASNLSLGANELDQIAVVSNGYTAQYGRQAGAQVNAATKSGTNAFHGNALYWWNGTDLNANEWFNKQQGNDRFHSNNNQWAASFGGPIIKNRLFFFADQEGARFLLPGVSGLNYLPTPAFSTYVLNNVNTTTPGSLPFYQNIFNLYGGSPGAKSAVPVTAADDPNLGCGDFSGTAGFGANGNPCAEKFTSGANNLNTEWLLATRVDYKISNSDTIFGRFKTDHGVQATGTDPINAIFDAESIQPAYEGQINETHAFGSNALNQLIVSGSWYSALFTANNLAGALKVFPTTMAFNDGLITQLGGTNNAYPQGRIVTQYQITDDFSKTHGAHDLKFGVNFRRNLVSDYATGVNTSGLLSINSMTEFVTGASSGGSDLSQNFTTVNQVRIKLYSLGIYGQDQWKATSKLAVTAALRFDRNVNPSCGQNCFTRLTGPFSAIGHDINTPYNQSIKTNQSHAFGDTQGFIFSPRLGMAYNLRENTVIRGGVGLFTDLFPAFVIDRFITNAPNVSAFDANVGPISPDVNGNLFAVNKGSAAAFQSAFSNGATLASLQAQFPGFQPPVYNDVNKNVLIPKFLEWNLSVEHQLNRQSSFALNYVGNHGYNVMTVNPYTNAYCRSSNLPGICPFGGQIGTTPTDQRFAQVVTLANQGYSNYHGLTATYNVRASKSFQAQFNYTWSHGLDTCSNNCLLPFSANTIVSIRYLTSPTIPGTAYGSSDYDVRHNFNANYVYNTPTNFSNGALRHVVGGWTVAGTVFFHTGYGWSPVSTKARGNLGNVTGIRNGTTLAEFAVDPSTLGHCSNGNSICASQADFVGVDPNTGQSLQSSFGNFSRNTLRGPNFFDTDMNVTKNIPLTERLKFAIGANFFNLFNHPNFDLPNNSWSAGNFGTITATVSPATNPYGAFLSVPLTGRIVQLNARVTF